MSGNSITIAAESQYRINFITTLTTTVATTVNAAVSAMRTYITGLQYQNTGSTASKIQILNDDKIILSLNAPATMSLPAVMSFDKDSLASSVNTKMNVKAVTTGANILVNIQGHTAV